MKIHRISLAIIIGCCAAQAQAPSTIGPSSLRSNLVAELRSVHNQPEWFFPLKASVTGLTPEQAAWVPLNSDGKTNASANHSVGMIATHILFWDTDALEQLRGHRTKGTATNDETFDTFSSANWDKTVRDLDSVFTALEELAERADDSSVVAMAPMIEHICTHTAYHTGQIFYVRKLQGTWKLDNDVKK